MRLLSIVGVGRRVKKADLRDSREPVQTSPSGRPAVPKVKFHAAHMTAVMRAHLGPRQVLASGLRAEGELAHTSTLIRITLASSIR
jgi:hypothetical protein